MGITISRTFYISSTPSRKRKRKITPVLKYWHEGDPVGLVLITVFRDATQDFMPLFPK